MKPEDYRDMVLRCVANFPALVTEDGEDFAVIARRLAEEVEQ